MSAPKSEKQMLLNLERPSLMAVPDNSPWGELARSGNFREAIPLIENELSAGISEGKSTKDKCLGKLWWVRAQLATEGMPLAALTTPLSEVLEHLKTLPEIASFACSTLYLFAVQLAKKKQTRLAAVFYDHALEFAAPLSKNERRTLRGLAAAVYRDEIERAINKREPEAYLSKLKARLAQLEREEIVEPETTEGPAVPENKRPAPLSAKAIRSADFSQRDIRDPDEPVLPSTADRDRSSPSQFTGFVFGVVCVLLLLLAWNLGFEKHKGELPQIVGIAELPKPVLPAAPASAPQPGNQVPGQASGQPAEPQGALPAAKNEAVEKARALDANLDTLGARLKNVTFKGIEKPKSIDEMRKDPEIDESALKSKEAERLAKQAAPPKDDDLASLDGKKISTNEPAVDPRKIPLLDPNRLGELPPTDLGPPQNPRSLEPAQREANDRDSIQPRLPDFGGPPDPKGKTLDGSPLQAYPVDRLADPRVFRTITETNVLSAPSLLAETVARLPPDTSVQVVSHVGQWLEIRSIGGQRGFIYSQNAVPAPESGREAHILDHMD